MELISNLTCHKVSSFIYSTTRHWTPRYSPLSTPNVTPKMPSKVPRASKKSQPKAFQVQNQFLWNICFMVLNPPKGTVKGFQSFQMVTSRSISSWKSVPHKQMFYGTDFQLELLMVLLKSSWTPAGFQLDSSWSPRSQPLKVNAWIQMDAGCGGIREAVSIIRD